jgi:hypothetical protein
MTFIQPQLQISSRILCIFKERKILEYSIEWLLFCVLEVGISVIDPEVLCKGLFSVSLVNSVEMREVAFLPHFEI